MAYQDDLITARDNIAAQIASITANPKPSYSIDGQSVSWGEHFNNLMSQLKELESAVQRAGGPFEVRSWGS